MTNFLISGSIAYDRIMNFDGLFAEHFLPEKLHAINLSFTVDTVAENFGGCAANIAYSLKLLGTSSSVISTAGKDFARYAAYLDALGIDSSTVRIDEAKLTALAFIMTDRADNQITAFSQGAGGTAYTPLPATAEASYAWVGPSNPDDMRTLPKHFKDANVPYFYDPGQAIPVISDQDMRDAIEGSAGLFGNDYELELIRRKTGWDDSALFARTPLVVTTLGEQGSSIRTARDHIVVPAVPVNSAIDPTGAGDAFRAGFLKGISAERSLRECAQLGSAVAAYAVETQGTQNHRFTMTELGERYAAAFGETLSL